MIVPTQDISGVRKSTGSSIPRIRQQTTTETLPMVQQKSVRIAAGIALALMITMLAYTGTVSSNIAVVLIVGIAGSLGLYESRSR